MITIRNKKGKRSKLFYFVWSAPLIGSACVLILLGYITYFSTDVLGLPSGLVGLLLLLSKIFDGVTDILAGYLMIGQIQDGERQDHMISPLRSMRSQRLYCFPFRISEQLERQFLCLFYIQWFFRFFRHCIPVQEPYILQGQ